VLLAQRERPGERGGLEGEQLEVVVQLHAGAELAVCRSWRATSRPSWQNTISWAPIRAATLSPASLTGSEYWFCRTIQSGRESAPAARRRFRCVIADAPGAHSGGGGAVRGVRPPMMWHSPLQLVASR
jgi:hypothetical protein